VTPFQFGVRLGRAQPGRCGDHVGADLVVEHDPARRETRAHVDRAGPASLPEAVLAAVRDLDAGGLAPLAAVPDDDVVTLSAVAARLRVPRAVAEELLHAGPGPLWCCSGEPLFGWAEVASALRMRRDRASTRIFEATNLALRLRTLTRDDIALLGLVRIIDG
jgi:hypothetical protein